MIFFGILLKSNSGQIYLKKKCANSPWAKIEKVIFHVRGCIVRIEKITVPANSGLHDTSLKTSCRPNFYLTLLK